MNKRFPFYFLVIAWMDFSLAAICLFPLSGNGEEPSLNSSNWKDRANTDVSEAKAFAKEERFEEALQSYIQAIELYEKYGREQSNLSTYYTHAALIAQQLNRNDLAETYLQNALNLNIKLGGNRQSSLITNYRNLARFYLDRNQYEKALPLFVNALALADEQSPANDSTIASILIPLVWTYHQLGDFDTAMKFCRRSIAILEKSSEKNPSLFAMALNQSGLLNRDLKNHAVAEENFNRSLGILKNTYPDLLGSDCAAVINNLGGLFEERMEYDRAEQFYYQALDIYKKIHGERHPQIAICLNNLAFLYDKQNRIQESLSLYTDALLIAIAQDDPVLLWNIQAGMSYIQKKLGHLSLSIFYGKQAVNTLQSMRKGISELGNQFQNSFLKTKEHVYKFLADSLIEEGRLPEAQIVLKMLKEEEYFDFIRRNSTSDLRETQIQPSPLEKENREKYITIQDRIVKIGNQLAEMKKKRRSSRTDEDEKNIQQLNEQMDIAYKHFKSVIEEIDRSFSAVSKTEISLSLRSDYDLRGFVKDVGHNSVLIHYIVFDEKITILLTTPESLVARQVSVPSSELKRKIFTFRELLDNPKRDPRPVSRELYQLLISPIEKDLQQADAKIVMLSVDGILRYIPFAALFDGEKYLAQSYAVSLFTESSKTKFVASPSKQWEIAGFGLSREIEGFSPLPSVPKELDSIVREGESDPMGVLSGIVHLNESFTQQSLKDSLMDEYPILHIASHFQLAPGDETKSFLLLGTGENLTLDRLNQNEFNLTSVDLLTLSACETAVGGVDATGKEIEGFGVLAQQKGARCVMATLWAVADESTGLFMERFYQFLNRFPEQSKAEAIRSIQLEFIQGKDNPGAKGEISASRGVISLNRQNTDISNESPFVASENAPFSHPFYWAPFIIIGNWM